MVYIKERCRLLPHGLACRNDTKLPVEAGKSGDTVLSVVDKLLVMSEINLQGEITYGRCDTIAGTR